MGDSEREDREADPSSSDRVTLKKEIGLLSACAIIIGKWRLTAALGSSRSSLIRSRRFGGKVNGATRGSGGNVAPAPPLKFQCRGTRSGSAPDPAQPRLLQ